MAMSRELMLLSVMMLSLVHAKEFNLVHLPNAKCIDGTPAAFYISRNSTSTKWVVWLEGGGICESLSDCQNRATTPLGSSSSYASSIDAPKGMLSSDPIENPDLYTWNRVYVPYCSGDIWSGTASAPLNPFPEEAADGWTGYFQGHSILQDLHDTLTRGANPAVSHAVLTGCSAGGIGTIMNCDWFASNFPSADVACRPEAGWFGLEQQTFPFFSQGIPDPDPRKLIASNWTVHIEPFILNTSIAQECTKDVLSGKRVFDQCSGQLLGPAWCCNSPPVIYAYSKTRMFISENTADAYQVYSSGECPGSADQCKKAVGNPGVTQFWEYIRGTIVNSLAEFVLGDPLKAADGMFTPACLVHCMAHWQGVKVRGKNDQEAFGDWYMRRGENHIFFDNSSSPEGLCACAQVGSPDASHDVFPLRS